MRLHNRLGSLVIALLLCASLPNVAHSVSSGERAALIAFYNATGGPGWTNRAGWGGSPGTECSWYGVYCGLPDSVTDLSFYGNNLNGSIPPQINGLTNLASFALFNESGISGPIPSEIGDLTNLTGIYFSGTNLTGDIPSTIGNLINLYTLSIYQNPQLNGTIPASIGNLINLQTLYLWGNALTGSIPPTVNNLVNLTDLLLHQNNFSGPLPDLSALINLWEIRLHSNQLSGPIPASLGSLTFLSSLDLSYNNFSGPIPGELAGLTNAWGIFLSNNQLTGPLPPELGNLVDLGYLELANNNITGEIPDSYMNLVNLMWVEGYGFSIENNGVHSSNPALITFLESRAWVPFMNFQTLDADGVVASNETDTGADLNWNPVTYTEPGGYRIYISTLPDTGFALKQDVADKTTTGAIVNGLNTCTTYYAKVHSYTLPFWQNPKNEVESDGQTGNVVSFTTGGCVVADTDGDGVDDSVDNCTLVANSDQRDTDGDGYGNICDPDFNNDGVVNTSDLFFFRSNYLSSNPDADLNGDGFANTADLFIIKAMYLKPPGPSALAP